MKEVLRESFSVEDSSVHLSLDMWASPNQFSFLAITTTDHSGCRMASIVKSALDEFGLIARLGCLTMDNASNSDTPIESLSEICPGSDRNLAASRIRSLPHII